MSAGRVLVPWTALALAACAAAPPPSVERAIPAPPPLPAAAIPRGGQPADLTTAHGGACTLAVFTEVPARVQGVQRVQADGASLAEFPAAGSAVLMSGSGRYYVEGRDWQAFEFRCTYDNARAAITDFTLRTL